MNLKFDISASEALPWDAWDDIVNNTVIFNRYPLQLYLSEESPVSKEDIVRAIADEVLKRAIINIPLQS